MPSNPPSTPSTPSTPITPQTPPPASGPRVPASTPPTPQASGAAAPEGAGQGDPRTHPALAEFCSCHERFEEVLQVLQGLPRHLRRQGPDEQARWDAAQVLACLDAEGPPHRAREERDVLPLLRRLGGPAGAVLAGRLEAEHGLLARAWGQCRPSLADLAGSGHWSAESAAFEYERWRDFVALATAHMLAEQGAAFPVVAGLLRGRPPA